MSEYLGNLRYTNYKITKLYIKALSIILITELKKICKFLIFQDYKDNIYIISLAIDFFSCKMWEFLAHENQLVYTIFKWSDRKQNLMTFVMIYVHCEG